ncbi:MAG: hypothetical protein ACYS6K_16035 [Planctomycetota bacterium]|jgi:hypothetical protein
MLEYKEEFPEDLFEAVQTLAKRAAESRSKDLWPSITQFCHVDNDDDKEN